MILLTLQNVNKSFGINTILKDVSLTLQAGSRMGLVGVNGSGKSTLFQFDQRRHGAGFGRDCAGKGDARRRADAGCRHPQRPDHWREARARVRAGARDGAQDARDGTGEAEKHGDPEAFDQLSRAYARLVDRFEDAGGYEWPSRIQGVLAGLGFARGRENQRADEASGGEKTRLCLARLLLTQPDLLMLDEPTNHLDLSSVEWLEETLKKYRGTVLVISHDRYFLNSVCDCMAELSMRHLTQ